MQTTDCAVSLGGGLNEVALNSVAKSKANNSTLIASGGRDLIHTIPSQIMEVECEA